MGSLQERRQFPVRFLMHAFDLLQGIRTGIRLVSVVERLQEGKVPARSAEMFWIARASAGLNFLPDCSVATSAARFRAICASTGKSASATLTHWALHPVAINEML